MAPLDVEDQARGEVVGRELGISLNMCLLGALVLLGLGILLFSGEWYLPSGALSCTLAPLSCPAPLLPSLLPPLKTSPESCLHPQVASQSQRLVSGGGARHEYVCGFSWLQEVY